MTDTPHVVFLFDVDNTLIDNDRVQAASEGAPGADIRGRHARPVLGNS